MADAEEKAAAPKKAVTLNEVPERPSSNAVAARNISAMQPAAVLPAISTFTADTRRRLEAIASSVAKSTTGAKNASATANKNRGKVGGIA